MVYSIRKWNNWLLDWVVMLNSSGFQDNYLNKEGIKMSETKKKAKTKKTAPKKPKA